MASRHKGSIGIIPATSSNVGGDRIGLHVIPIDSSGTINANAARLDAISSVLGTVDDAAITSGSSGTLSGKQRGALTIWADVYDSANHALKTYVNNSPSVSPVAGSTWNVRALNSSAADLQMTATPAAGSTWNVRALNSSAADLQATVTPAANSTFTVQFPTPLTSRFTEASINTSSNGDNTIVSSAAGQTIRVYRLFFVTTSSVTVTVKDGASALTGGMSLSPNAGFVLDFQGDPWFTTTAGAGFVLNTNSTAVLAGRAYYTKS